MCPTTETTTFAIYIYNIFMSPAAGLTHPPHLHHIIKPPTFATVYIIRECSPRPWAGLNFNKLFTDATRIFLYYSNFSFCLLLHLLLHFPPFLMSGRRWKFIHFPAKHKKHKRHHLELLFEKSFASTFMRATESQNRIIKGEMEKEVFHWWLKSVKYK